ncbi:acetyltransferase, partial [Vibrio cholerae]
RCQPLRRALCALEEVWNNLIVLSII